MPRSLAAVAWRFLSWTWTSTGMLGCLAVLVVSARAQAPDFMQEEFQWRRRPEWRELEEAVESRNEADVLRLVEAHPRLAGVYRVRMTPLLGWAAGNGMTNLMATLIRQGAMKAEQEGRNRFPSEPAICLAAESGWGRSVRMLLAAGADAQDMSDSRGTPLDRLVQNWMNGGGSLGPWSPIPAPPSEREDAARALMEAGVNLFAPRTDYDSNSPLYSLSLPWSGVADLLLTNAIPGRQTNATGDTLMHLAARVAATNALEVFVRRGDAVDATNRLGWTPLHLVAQTAVGSGGGRWSENRAPEWWGLTLAAELEAERRESTCRTLLALGARHDGFTAAGLGDSDALSRILAADAQVIGRRDSRGRTPLHWAALADQASMVRALAEREADLAAVDAEGNTALHLAVLTWPSSAALALLELKAPLERTNAAGLTPLAVASFSSEAIQALIDAGAKVEPAAGEPPLLRAVKLAANAGRSRAYMPMMRLPPGGRGTPFYSEPTELRPVLQLLKAGAGVDVRDGNGRSLAQLACDAGNLNLLEVLCLRGDRLDRKDAAGDPVWFGVLRYRAELAYSDLPTVVNRLWSRTPAWLQAAGSKLGVAPGPPETRPVAVLSFLAKLGADLKATNAAGQTALHVLAQRGLGGRPGGPLILGPHGPMGGVPMRPGAGGKDAEAERLAFLMKAGLSLEGRDRGGMTPWLTAWRHTHADVGEALLKAGADPKATDAMGRNALHLVCLPSAEVVPGQPAMPRFFGPVIPMLVAQGVDPKGRDVHGATPLHYAVVLPNQPFVAQELLEAGADPGAKDDAGVTPLDIAREAGRPEVVALLRAPRGVSNSP